MFVYVRLIWPGSSWIDAEIFGVSLDFIITINGTEAENLRKFLGFISRSNVNMQVTASHIQMGSTQTKADGEKLACSFG